MARPPEMSLTYFPHYVDAGDQFERVVARHGFLGKWLWFELLESIYGGKGYYMPYEEEDMEFIADKYRAPRDQCRAALAMMIERKMFHPVLFEKHLILTSGAIQKQYLFSKRKGSVLKLIRAFWLIDETETITDHRVAWVSIDATNTGVSVTETPPFTALIPQNHTLIPQSKVKESKEKERKENIEIAREREELSLEANPQEPEAVSVTDAEPWMRATNSIARLVAHLEATRPIEGLPGGIIRARSKQSEQGWLALFFQGYGEEKVHAAIAEVDSGGWYCTERHIRAALRGEMASLYPSRGSRNRSSFRPKDDLHEKLSNPEEYYFQEDSK